MPSLGLGELLLIGIAIIIFVRPEDLPKFIRSVGKIYAQARNMLTKCHVYTRETLSDISQIEGKNFQEKFSPPVDSKSSNPSQFKDP